MPFTYKIRLYFMQNMVTTTMGDSTLFESHLMQLDGLCEQNYSHYKSDLVPNGHEKETL